MDTITGHDQERVIASLRQEQRDLRQKETAYRNLQDQVSNLEMNFKRATDEKNLVQDNFNCRLGASATMIARLKQEIEDQRKLHVERKKQISDLYQELDNQKGSVNSRHSEVAHQKNQLNEFIQLND